MAIYCIYAFLNPDNNFVQLALKLILRDLHIMFVECKPCIAFTYI